MLFSAFPVPEGYLFVSDQEKFPFTISVLASAGLRSAACQESWEELRKDRPKHQRRLPGRRKLGSAFKFEQGLLLATSADPHPPAARPWTPTEVLSPSSYRDLPLSSEEVDTYLTPLLSRRTFLARMTLLRKEAKTRGKWV